MFIWVCRVHRVQRSALWRMVLQKTVQQRCFHWESLSCRWLISRFPDHWCQSSLWLTWAGRSLCQRASLRWTGRWRWRPRVRRRCFVRVWCWRWRFRRLIMSSRWISVCLRQPLRWLLSTSGGHFYPLFQDFWIPRHHWIGRWTWSAQARAYPTWEPNRSSKQTSFKEGRGGLCHCYTGGWSRHAVVWKLMLKRREGELPKLKSASLIKL